MIRIGFFFMEDIIWVKPEPSVPNRNWTFFKYKKPLTWKPNVVSEYLMVYRKGTDKLIGWNLRHYDDEITKESLIQGITKLQMCGALIQKQT